MTAILGDMRHDLGIAGYMIHSDAAQMDMEWARWTGIVWTKNTRP